MPTISERNSIPFPSISQNYSEKQNDFVLQPIIDKLNTLIEYKFSDKLLNFIFVNAAKKIREEEIQLIPEATAYLEANYPNYGRREIVMMYVLQKFLDL